MDMMILEQLIFFARLGNFLLIMNTVVKDHHTKPPGWWLC